MKYYPDAMKHTDDARTEFVSSEWRRLGFFFTHKIFWEFITLVVKPIDGPYNPLLNHTDTMNCWRLGFHHCAVYWYIYTAEDDTRYRVTIIMTFRRVWGSAIKSLKDKKCL
jgi:hypothetical protein